MASQTEIVQELFKPLTYRGPGSKASTCRALAAIPDLTDRPQILDIGCGPGRQTLHLAEQIPSRLTAVDLDVDSVATLAGLIGRRGLADRISAIRASMFQLCFADDAFDLIWSEGAIYCMGFAAGLAAWRRYLRPGGYIALTELTWLSEAPPRATQMYWKEHYPAMLDVRDNLAAIDRAGYQSIDTFSLPESDWWDPFYRELSAELDEFRRRHAANGSKAFDGRGLIEHFEGEMDALRESQGSYSYVFYIMRKPC